MAGLLSACSVGRGLQPFRRLTQLGQARRTHKPCKSRQPQVSRCEAPPAGAAGAAFLGDGDQAFSGSFSPPPAEAQPSAGSEPRWHDDSSAAAGPSSDAEGKGLAPGGGAGAAAAGASAGGVGGGGPLYYVKQALRSYDHAVKANPVLTKGLTSLVGFALGDRIAQYVGGGAYDPFRCARLSLYGLLLDGPIGHAWYKLLDRHVYPEEPTSTKAVLLKTALDQLVWGPIMTVVFFAFLKTLEGHPELILTTIQQRFIPTMLANYVLWPLAHLVNFRYVPTDYRILFNNVVAIGWTTYLSFTCGPASGVASTSGGGGDVAGAAAAASAMLFSVPCNKVPDALSGPGIAEAVRHVSAMERIVGSWGAQSLPSSDLVVSYLHMKAEVLQRVCQPIRMPPS